MDDLGKIIVNGLCDKFPDGKVSCFGGRQAGPRKVTVLNFRFSVAYRYEVLRGIMATKTVKVYQPLGKQAESAKDKIKTESNQQVSPFRSACR